MNLYWNCPNCKEKVELLPSLSTFLFKQNGEADFNEENGASFFQYCCGYEWKVTIGGRQYS
jgi:hypothetical protein